MDCTALFAVPWWKHFDFDRKVFRHILTDRKSKYTASAGKITSKVEAKIRMKELTKDKQFAKATHNSYARRIVNTDGSVDEWRNDDGEKGAGNCILREMKRENVLDGILVVTRYYGGIKLHWDRFRNVIEVSREFLKWIGKK